MNNIILTGVAEMNEDIIKVTNVNKSYSENNKVLNNISFTVKKGEFVTLLGESGCGKSSLLNIVGGFLKQDSGQVLLNNEEVLHPSRNCLMLFQDNNLLPWRSVLANVELGINGINSKEKAIEALKLVGLEKKLHLAPRDLSGGQQQRIAIARGLALKSECVLLDEPFSALDTFNRYRLQEEFINMQKNENMSALLVTHDIEEAVYLSDKILIMSSNPGEIEHTIEIKLSKPRDRASSNFNYYREKIYEAFELSTQLNKPEYYI